LLVENFGGEPDSKKIYIRENIYKRERERGYTRGVAQSIATSYLAN
jgi:hypothetical protein